jgi:hypothetical protein
MAVAHATLQVRIATGSPYAGEIISVRAKESEIGPSPDAALEGQVANGLGSSNVHGGTNEEDGCQQVSNAMRCIRP